MRLNVHSESHISKKGFLTFQAEKEAMETGNDVGASSKITPFIFGNTQRTKKSKPQLNMRAFPYIIALPKLWVPHQEKSARGKTHTCSNVEGPTRMEILKG